MRYLKLKDQKLRLKFKTHEIKLNLKNFVIKNLLSYVAKSILVTAKKKKILYYQILKKKKFFFLTKVVRRCIFTNRSKSVRLIKLSRLQTKDLISFGIVPGYKKAVW